MDKPRIKATRNWNFMKKIFNSVSKTLGL